MEELSYKIFVASQSDAIELPLEIPWLLSAAVKVTLREPGPSESILTIHCESKTSVIKGVSVELSFTRQTPAALKL